MARSGKHHGGSGTRLYKCWSAMRERSAKREGCSIYEGWDKFPDFKVWALSAGYNDQMVLCRKGDVGDYVPSNVRWDTNASNIAEGNSKHWTCEYKGKVVEIYNMAKFCRDNNLCKTSMSNVVNHKTSAISHKGYTGHPPAIDKRY